MDKANMKPLIKQDDAQTKDRKEVA